MTSPTHDSASDLVRWAAFSCVLVPVVLVLYGTSLGGAAGTALGLAAVTGVCRVLLRQSERCAARTRTPAEESVLPRARHGRAPSSAYTGAQCGAAPSGSHSGTHSGARPSARRGGRHSGGTTPVD
ncbi:hypothetical protein [Streptomyces graminilatus]|uniref:hypothetical protein n=1 Tax=Streptomyces graminilatus TaxID=1464070 RepID=UPI0006E22F3B|nr:hypothetical protein [Streptomyces graminilatus]